MLTMPSSLNSRTSPTFGKRIPTCGEDSSAPSGPVTSFPPLSTVRYSLLVRVEITSRPVVADIHEDLEPPSPWRESEGQDLANLDEQIVGPDEEVGSEEEGIPPKRRQKKKKLLNLVPKSIWLKGKRGPIREVIRPSLIPFVITTMASSPRHRQSNPLSR